MREDKIVSALIGLVGACDNNPKTANTDSVVIKALALPVLCQELDDESLLGMMNEIYAEKNAVAPNCASCASPCGHTSDYDMSRIYEAEADIRSIKLELLSKCQKLAVYAYQSKEPKEALQIDLDFFYKLLSYLSFDIGKEQLLALLEETETIERKIEHKIGQGGLRHDKKNHKN